MAKNGVDAVTLVVHVGDLHKAWNYLYDGRSVERLGPIDPIIPVEILGFSREDCRRGTVQTTNDAKTESLVP